MTVTVALDATLGEAWDLWADPRKLEKWWGPPTWPATFEDFTLDTGQEATYFMTGPEGEKAGGWWKFLDIQDQSVIELEDGFLDGIGNPDSEIPPMRMVVKFEDRNGATHLEMTSYFRDQGHFDEMIAMGMEQGLAGALGQMDEVVAQ